MKLKFIAHIVFILFCSISFSQDFENDLSSLKNIDDQIQEESYSTDKVTVTDRLIVQNPIKKDKGYSKKEWRKIKKQLKRNKKRFSNIKNDLKTYKTLDTIYLDTPLRSNESRLSGW